MQIRIVKLLLLFLVAISISISAAAIAEAKQKQPLNELVASGDRIASVDVLTDQGTFEYHLDNTGERDVSAALQEIFDRTAALKDASATLRFLPGVYFIDAPIHVRLVSVELEGRGHGGLDVHGMCLKSGTVFQFGKNTGPNCITFHQASHSESFPAKETPWENQNSKVFVNGMTFMGYNNTGVDTDKGYSRFRNDEPNFRGLNWWPAEGRYGDVEKEGQRALVFTRRGKNELLRVSRCYFTDLYVGLDVPYCDVAYITDNWFAQLVYGIRIQDGPVLTVNNNCFADLETGVIIRRTKASKLNENGFAYVSKCFELDGIHDSTVCNNTLTNWNKSTGAAAFGAFVHVGSSKNLVMNGNSINQAIDSRCKTRTIDPEPNGRAFINIEKSENLMFANNVVNTVQSQTVFRLHDVRRAAVTDNIITYGKGGNAVAQTGNCSEIYYRPLIPEHSVPMDEFVE
ncbi:MAG: NosD domain-containing protein [Rhodopirellula sp. JB044]|uniref:NosD domain-containing protein n=1 Tax=Rhodopirellula sp. JB044 TaxID=3342844 RepID=UPI003709F217